MKKFIAAFIILLVAPFSYSQEVCNNAIDDDGDGLIDLNDTDCICQSSSVVPPSLIPNASFENSSYCPNFFSQMDAAAGWIQATGATSDYLNTCGFVTQWIPTCPGALPFPDGNGAVAFYMAQDYKEYIGSCLSGTLQAGVPYTLTCKVYMTNVSILAGTSSSVNGVFSPVLLTIFGAGTCGNIPYSTMQCPGSPFTAIATALYTPQSSWQTVTFNFTPSADINEIVLGPPCILPADYTSNSDPDPHLAYVVADNLVLNSTASFSSIPITQTGSLCTGNAILSTTATGGTFQWYKDGVAIIGENQPTLNVTATGNYTLTQITTAGCSSGSYQVAGTTAPVVVSVNNASICPGETVTLTASGAGTYTWSPATGLSATTGSSVTCSATSTTQYTVTGTDSGCSGTATSTVTVTNSDNISVNNAVICNGQTATLTASGADSYTWSPATGLSATTGSSVTCSATSTIQYTVTGMTSGCSGTTTSVVTVNTPDNVSVNGAALICNGQSTTLTASGSGSYAWSPATGLSAITGGSVTCSATSTTQYTVTETTSGCSGTDTLTVVVKNSDPVSVNNAVICKGQFATLVASGSGSYIWSPSTGLSATTGSSVTCSATSTTIYTVTETVSGCSGSATSTVTVAEDNVYITASPNPALVENTQIAFASNETNGTFTWYFGDGSGSSDAAPLHMYDQVDSTYLVTLYHISPEGCKDTAHLKIIILPGISFYVPNAFTPDGDEFNNTFNPVLSEGIDPYSYHLTIFDRWGETLFESLDIETGWDGTYYGKLVKEGVYAWKITFTNSLNAESFERHGSVTLLR
jgi:gliding motility-associated-like protein